MRKIGQDYPLSIYLGAVAVITGVLSAGLVAHSYDAGASIGLLTLALVLALLVTSQLAVTIVNWLATLLVTPRSLSRMDYDDGVAPEARTLVVVPTMFTDVRGVEQLIEALEVRFLANRDPRVHFALLTDFPDAAEETLPSDAPLLHAAQTGIDELNRTYRRAWRAATPDSSNAEANEPAGGDPFYLLHRPRRWNPQQRVWMGYERKRGKLGDLNSLLRGDPRDRFSLIVGATDVLSQVRYVITLDTDTKLPRDSARQLIGAMAHPLNRPQFDRPRSNRNERDAGRRIVTAGYGILQPRVAVSLPGTRRSHYARLTAGEPGLDPYTRTVSDVYQDAFGEGSFIGKGIYDVDSFEAALAERFPDDRILSHDLLEGCYARSGLLSDVQLYEEFPARYSADVARRHRWIRGDWQLAGWLRRRVPSIDGRSVLNPLSWLSQWKIFDNLRRSLVPAALLLLLLMGWAALPNPALWTITVMAVLLMPAVVAALTDLVNKPTETPLEQHLGAVAHTARTQFAQALLALAWLPYEAYYCLDAIARTLWRVLVRQRLLEWNPSSEVERAIEEGDNTDLVATYRTMWIAPATAVLTWTVMPAMNVSALRLAAPILLLWLISPAIAWWISRPLAPRTAALAREQAQFLRRLARRTWAYFETYVGAEENWLPPDNVQEKNEVVIAHRTSPTNIGLALLADLTAHDFGYLSAGQLVTRTTNTLRTLQSLERYRGHFFNWYDTRTLAPLNPRYISTVDSGNLVGHLMTLRAGLGALADAPIVNPRWLEGIGDTFEILREAVGQQPPRVVVRFATALGQVSAAHPTTPAALSAAFDALAARAAEVAEHYVALVSVPQAAPPMFSSPAPADRVDHHQIEAVSWSRALARQCADMRDELIGLTPWLSSQSGAMSSAHDAIPTLRELA
ncbi:MAG TPA: cyclic beta 1-2 glucan synthetase, partial [Burkholderiaceae bacterium]|nr:cyclic beta 1-2 glucan synthetase [Burkholderiaceae bacterium]